MITGNSLMTKKLVHSVFDNSDADDDTRTKFYICAVPSKHLGILKDRSTTTETDQVTKVVSFKYDSSHNWTLLRLGLSGWENFLDGDGNEIPFETEKFTFHGKEFEAAKMELIELLPLPVAEELAVLIDNYETVDAEPMPKEA